MISQQVMLLSHSILLERWRSKLGRDHAALVYCFSSAKFGNPVLDAVRTFSKDVVVAYLSKTKASDPDSFFLSLRPYKAKVKLFDHFSEDLLLNWFNEFPDDFKRVIAIDSLKDTDYVPSNFIYKVDEIYQLC